MVDKGKVADSKEARRDCAAKRLAALGVAKKVSICRVRLSETLTPKGIEIK